MALRWGICSTGKISHDFSSCLKSMSTDEHQVKFCVIYLLLSHVHCFTLIFYIFVEDCIGAVMGSMLDSIAVDYGFELRSSKTKDYKIGICYFMYY